MTTQNANNNLTLADQVFDLLDGYISSSVVGMALETNLFWILDESTLSAESIAVKLGIPLSRCRYSLQYLCKLGFLTNSSNGYRITERARRGVVDAYSQETWAFLVVETREKYALFEDLAAHFNHPGSIWELMQREPPSYIDQMKEDPDRAVRFTRMLYEIHRELATEIARQIDLQDIKRIMDLGGGSGVVSMACLEKDPDVEAVVVDIPYVCQAGSALAKERGFADRIAYHPLDFRTEALPTGFDLIIECDVAIYEENLFMKVLRALSPDGKFVIVDQFAPSVECAPTSRLAWSLGGSLHHPDFRYLHAGEVKTMLTACGFEIERAEALLIRDSKATRFSDDMMIIQARIQG